MVIVKPARELADIVEEEKAARERESEECQAVAGHVEASLAVLDKLQAALDEQEIDILRLKSDVRGKQRALKVFKDREAMHTALCSRGGPATAPLSVLWVFAHDSICLQAELYSLISKADADIDDCDDEVEQPLPRC